MQDHIKPKVRLDGWNEVPPSLAAIMQDEELTPREKLLLTAALFVHDCDGTLTHHTELVA